MPTTDLLTSLAPAPGKGLAPRNNGRRKDTGPNPFLDNRWLWQSYENKQDYEVIVPGGYEEYTMKKGAKKGQTGRKLVGDAAQVVQWLREAADQHQIGVAIQIEPAKRKGHLVIKYLGQARKAARKSTTEPTPDAS